MCSYKIVDGVYVGPEVYRGSLWLRGPGVTSLGSLREVGDSLDLRGTGVTDLGKLSKVGRYVLTGPGNYYELPKLQDLVKEIVGYSVSDLVERLPVEEDPFLKRVIERRIRE